MLQSTLVDGLEREFVTVIFPTVVRRLAASIVAATACQFTPAVEHCRIVRILGVPLVPVHRRRKTHAINACGSVSMSGFRVVTIPLAITKTHDLADLCSRGQRSVIQCRFRSVLPVISESCQREPVQGKLSTSAAAGALLCLIGVAYM